MSKTPELFVLPDPTEMHPDRWAVVADSELPIYEGHLRGSTRGHAGRWAYPFPTLDSALMGAQHIREALA